MTKKLLIVGEKHQQILLVLQALPELKSEYDIDAVDFRGMGLFRFNFPKNLPISQSPKIKPIDWCFLGSNNEDLNKSNSINFNCSYTYPYSRIDTGIVKRNLLENHPSVKDQLDAVKEKIGDYNLILMAPDPDHRGMFFGTQIIEYLTSSYAGSIKIESVVLDCGLDKKSIEDAYDARSPYVGCSDKFARYGTAKYYFEWLWMINSAPIFGKALRLSGAESNKIFSKYELLTFLLLSKGKLKSQDSPKFNWICDISQQMCKYQGTRKYVKDSEYCFQAIGSASSTNQIFRNLVERGLIDDNGKITYIGEIFSTHIHKRSFDPDLAYRIDKWSSANDTEGMEKYISNFFKRQKNFNSTLKL